MRKQALNKVKRIEKKKNHSLETTFIKIAAYIKAKVNMSMWNGNYVKG